MQTQKPKPQPKTAKVVATETPVVAIRPDGAQEVIDQAKQILGKKPEPMCCCVCGEADCHAAPRIPANQYRNYTKWASRNRLNTDSSSTLKAFRKDCGCWLMTQIQKEKPTKNENQAINAPTVIPVTAPNIDKVTKDAEKAIKKSKEVERRQPCGCWG